MSYHPVFDGNPVTTHVSSKVGKAKSVHVNVANAGVLIVYGDVKGNVYDCDNVVIINGDVYGNISNCDNVTGLLADKAVRCHTYRED